MARKTQKTVKLGPEAMSELFKPARLEIYEGLQIAGPSSIADLALRLGRPADSLYYHVKKLLAIGVIEEHAEEEPEHSGPGRKGVVYTAAAGRLDARLNPRSRRSREAWSEAGISVLRLAQRDYGKSVDKGDIQPEGVHRNLAVQRVKVRLDASQLKEVNEHLGALHELLLEHSRNTKGDLHAITYVMTPLEERSKR